MQAAISTVNTGTVTGVNWTDSSAWSNTACTPTHSCYHYWTYPSCVHPDNMRKAFSIVRHLMDNKLVKKPLTVEQFVKLVDKVYELL